jgi:DNA-directed RNA polymerase subunit RPC12/RpoP
MAGMKLKKFASENNYDVSVECTECGAAVTINEFQTDSKDKVRCPYCKAIFKPKPSDVRL